MLQNIARYASLSIHPFKEKLLFLLFVLWPFAIKVAAQSGSITKEKFDSILNGKNLAYTQTDSLGSKFIVILKPADFRGGVQGWGKFLENNLNADIGCKYVKVKGIKKDSIIRQSVVVNFTVEPNGLLSNIQAEKTEIHPKLVEEALRVLSISPRWLPAYQIKLLPFQEPNLYGKILQAIETSKKEFVIYRNKQNITFQCTVAK